jgi:hypothetical protein
MERHPALTVATLVVAALVALSAGAWSPTAEEGAGATPFHVRVIDVQNMTGRDATMLVRRQAQVRSVAWIEERAAMIVRDTADVVDKCEALLRERDAVQRVTDPHAPLLALRGPTAGPPDTRVFRLFAFEDSQKVATIVRAIYSVRELTEFLERSEISIRAPQPVLDAIEALLGELELLAPAD